MKVEEGVQYQIEFLKDFVMECKIMDDPDDSFERKYCEGDREYVEVAEVNGDEVGFYFEDDVNSYAENIPMDCFKVLKVREVTWREVN